MAKTLFVDETAFIALNSPIATQHTHAVDFVRTLLGETVRVVTSELAIALAANELKARNGAEAAERFIKILRDGGISIRPLPEQSFDNAQSLFLQSKHLVDVSFTDCLHVTFMQHYQIPRIFTFKEYMGKMNVIVEPK